MNVTNEKEPTTFSDVTSETGKEFESVQQQEISFLLPRESDPAALMKPH